MNYAALALGLAFAALGIAFLARARKSGGEGPAKNARFAACLMLFASAAFLFSSALSLAGAGDVR